MTFALMPHRHCLDCGAVLAPMDEVDRGNLARYLAKEIRCDPRRCEACCDGPGEITNVHQPPPAPAAELAELRELERLARSLAAGRRLLDGDAAAVRSALERLDALREATAQNG